MAQVSVVGMGLLFAPVAGYAADGDYRSAASGNWNSAGTWQVESNSTWVTPAAAPTSANGAITVRNGHTVTVTAAVTVDQTVLEAGGQITVNSGITLTIANGTGTDMTVSGVLRNSGTITTTGALAVNAGGTYQHALNGGAIPAATWDAASTCEVTGVTGTLPTASTFTQSFGHVIWNCTGQTAGLNLAGNLKTINGDFKMQSTGSGSLWLVDYTSSAIVLNVGGNFIQSGGNLIFYYGSLTGYAGSMTMNVAGNFSLTGGMVNLSDSDRPGTVNVAGAFTHTGGTITELYTSYGAINFNGTSPQVFTSGGYVSNTINFTVNSGATLMLGTNLLGSGSGGSFTLAAGATLGIGDANGIATSGATGNIRVTGTRTYNASANYIYNGSAAQAAGNGLTAASNLTITNSAGVALSGWVTVTNSLALAAGSLVIGTNTLTINGAIDQAAGGLTGGASAKIVIGGSGAATTLPTVQLNNLTVNRAAGIALGGAVSVGGTLTLTSGAITSASNLTTGNGATISRATGSLDAVPTFGTSVNVVYTAGGVTTGPELPTVASVLNHLTISHTSGTVTLNADATVNGNLVTTAGGTLDLNGHTLTVKGNVANGGTITGGGKLLLAGSSAQTLSGTGGYGNVELDNAAGASLSANTTINGTLNVTTGTFTAGAYSLAVSGATTVDSTLAITSATGTKIFTGLVTINNGASWTNSGNSAVTFRGGIANNGAFTAGTGVHTFDTDSQNLTGTFSIPNVTVMGVTLTNNDNLTVGTALSGTGGLLQAAGATLTIGGTSGITTLTAAAVGNTVNYNGTAQTVKPTTYENLVLSGSGAKTLTSVSTINGNLNLRGTATATTAAAMTIGRNLDIGNGTTFTAAGYNLTVTGTTTVGEGTSGALVINNAAGTKTFVGQVTVNPGATWNNSGNSAATFRGGIANSGTFTAGTGVHTFDTNNQNLSGTLSIPSVTVTGVTLTNGNSLTVGTALAGTGGLTQATGAMLNIGGTSGITTLTATATGNTVNYAGAAQTVHGNNYWHLALTGSGAKTLPAGLSAVSGDLTLGGTASATLAANLDVAGFVTLGSGTTLDVSASNYSLNVAGNWVNNGGTFSARSGTVTLVGASAQSLGGSAASTFYNLTLNNAAGATLGASETVGGTLTLTSGQLAVGANTLTLNGPAIAGTPNNLVTTSASSLSFGGSAGGVNLPSSVTALNNLTLNNANGLALNSSPAVSGTLTLTSGKITTGTNTLVIVNTSNSAISGGSATSYVVGNLQKAFAAGGSQAITFPVGDASSYAPLALASMGVGTAGSLAVTTAAGDHAQIASSGIDASRSVNRTWTLTPGGGFAATYNATFNYPAGEVDGGVAASQFVVRRYTNSDTWAITTISGAPTTSNATISAETGFGDFAIGNQTVYAVAFTVQPANAAAGATIAPAVQATATDIFGVGVPSASISVALTSGSGTLSGTLTQTANANGVASFTNLSINLTGAKQLTAICSGKSGQSGVFQINPAAANQLVIATQPSATATAGVAFAQQPVVRIEDVYGNLRTNDTLAISVARLGGAGTLLGITNVVAVGGVATFTDLAHPLVSNITILFSNGTFAATSTTIAVGAGPFTKLQVLLPGETAVPGTASGKTGTPSGQTAGTGFTFTVNAVDAWWNLVNTVTDTARITGTDANAALPADAALAAGTRTFSATNRTAGSWTLTATDIADSGKTANTSPAYTVNAGALAKLQLLLPGETAAPGTTAGKTGTPDDQTAGVAWTATVRSVDANWNLVSSAYTNAITTTDPYDVLPANAALVGGIRTCVVTNKTAGIWTATASNNVLGGSTSPAYTVNPGPFVKLQLLVPGETAVPGSATGKTGTPLAQTAGTPLNVTVNAVDANWNAVSTNNTAWAFRKAIAIDHTKVSNTDQTDFPVLVNLATDADLAANAQSGGQDILFTTADGSTVLPYEREAYTGATGALIAWVKVPVLSATTDTLIYMYYGNPGVGDQQQPANVWDTNFKGVWHLKEATDVASTDSTSNGCHGTPTNSPAQTTGMVAGGLGFNGSTMEDRVASTFGLGTANVTMEAWVYLSSSSLSGAFLKIGGTSPNQGYGMGVGNTTFDNSGNNFLVLYEGSRWIPTGKTLGTGWHHVATAINGLGRAIAYLDGTNVFNDTGAAPLAPASAITFIGGYTSATPSNRHFSGILDEVRVSSVIRSADWIKTGYANQSAPVSFYSVGPALSVAPAATDTVTITSTDANAVLPANAALSGGTQTFAVTFKTAGNWTLTASDVTDPGKSANTSPSITVNAGALSKLQVLLPGETAAPGTTSGKTGTPNNQTAGTTFSVVIRAVDDNWNLVSSTHTVGLTSSDGAAVLPANGALTAGSRTVAMTNRTAGLQTVTAADSTQPAIPSGVSANYVVVPAAANKLTIAVQPSGGATAGVAFAQQPVIRVEDAYGNLRSNDTPAVTATRGTGTVPLLGTTIVAAAGGIASYADLYHPKAETITIVFSASGLTSATSTSVAVSAGPFTQLQVLLWGETWAPGTVTGKTGTPASKQAGNASTATVYAVDAWWNLVNAVTDTVRIACTDPNTVLPASAALAAGTRTFVFANRTVGSWTATATDLSDVDITPGTSAAFTVNANTLTKLQVLMPGETAVPGSATGKTGTPTPQTAGTAFTVTVNSVDAFWNLVSCAYTVSIDTTDPYDVRPANAALVAGTKTFVVTNKTAGTWTLTADEISPNYIASDTGTSYAVNAGAFIKLQILAPGETAVPGTTNGKTGTPNAQTAGTPFNVAVNAVDANWNVVGTVTDTIGITATDPNAVLPANAALSAGTGSFGVTFRTAGGTRTVTATNISDGSKAPSTSAAIAVNAGAFEKLLVLLPGEFLDPGTPMGRSGSPSVQTAGVIFTARVYAVDANWNSVSTNNVVGLLASDPAAMLPANVALTNGNRTFVLTNRTSGMQFLTATNVTQPAIANGVSTDYLVQPAAANKLVIVTQPSTNALAGIPFTQQPVIWITDVFGNRRTNDTLTVSAERLAGAGTLLGTTNIVAVAGIATYTNLAHPLPTNITIRFSSGALGAATSSVISVSAATFSKLQVLVPGEIAAPGTPTGKTGAPETQVAGVAFSVTVRAVDDNWNLITSVTDSVSITSSDASATLPFAAALAGGTGIFSVTMNNAGSWTVTAADGSDGRISNGTSAAIFVIEQILQEFFLPMPEAHIRTAFNTISAGIGTNMVAIFSLVVSVPGTVVVYDQWEDGYEANLNNPTNSNTKIWGDGNNANGICPGFTNDPASIPAGTVISLRNNVGIPRTNAIVLYDGGDRVSATRPLTVTRAGWENGRGPVQGSSAEVHSTMNHGTNYVAPLGEDVTANGMFTYSGLMVMADQDNTTVIIDTDGTNSLAPTTNVINRGYYGAMLVNDGIKKGATVKSDKPIQVHMITGDTSATYESRSFVLHSREIWSANYIIPVGTVNATYPGRAYIFNTNAAPLTVAYTNRTTSGTLTIPGTNGLLAYQLPLNEGTMLSSTNGPFYAVCIMGCVNDGSAGDSAYDWALTPLTLGSLTTEAVCGWGPGDANIPPQSNGDPVWVMPMGNTTVYVDFNGDYAGPVTDPIGGYCDVATNLAALQMARFFDPDKDQTGLRVYTLDGTLIAAAWGEDASQVQGGNPFLDMGYALVPIPKPVLAKTSALAVDVTPSGLSLDDTLEYTIRLDNKSLQTLYDVVIKDILPPQVRYIADTTYLIRTNQGGVTTNMLSDNVIGTLFPLDGDGYSLLEIPAGGAAIFKFRVRIDGSGCFTNRAYADNLMVPNVVCVTTPTTIRGTVWEDLDGDGVHDGEETGGLTNVMVVLFNSNNVAIATNYTDSNGLFSFSGTNITALTAGTYTVVETDPAGFLSTWDSQGTNDNRISVTVAANETKNNNDFLDTHPAWISGSVRVDSDGDGWLDAEDTNGLAGVTVTLYTAGTTSLVATTTTGAGGDYGFSNVYPGAYLVVETDPSGCISTGDAEGSNDNTVAVTVVSHLNSTNHFFMDALPGSIRGYSCDGDGDGFFNPATDTPLVFVAITLYHAGRDGLLHTADDLIQETKTGLDGMYAFTAIPPGAYAIQEDSVAAYCYLDLADADGGDPNEIILTLGMGEDRTHQDFENTHWLGIPGVVYNASVMSSNEFIWTDKSDEQRVENTNSMNADIRELRMFANASNFYIRVKVKDITDDRLAYVAIGLDTRRHAGSAAMDWLGDDSGLGIGGGYFDPPAATHHPVRNVIIHRVGDSAKAEIFASDGYAWYPPPSGWSAAIISTNSNTLELRIPRADLTLNGTVTGRFTVASFLNTGLWANEGDSSVTAYPGTPDASDSVSIPPVQVNDGRLDVSAWREDISDFDIDFWLDVRFGPSGIVDNVPPSAPAAVSPTNNAEGSARPTLSWSASTDSDGQVTGYFLEVSTNASFNGATGMENGLIALRVNLPPTQTNYVLSTAVTQYWWRVRARDTSGALSTGTIQSFRIGGKADIEGPAPTLLYVGTNLTGFLAGHYDEFIDRYGYIQSITDGDVANGVSLGFAIRWDDPNGVFATNWMHAGASTPGAFTWNLRPEDGRVSPNWDVMVTNPATGEAEEWVTDRVFQGSNVSAVGNAALTLTNWALNGFAITQYQDGVEYYLKLSGEDGCTQNGYEWTEGSWASYGESGTTWGGYAADGPNSSRNNTANLPMRIEVVDDDVLPPVAARGAGWPNDRSLLASNSAAILGASGSGQAVVYREYDGALLSNSLTFYFNTRDAFSGIQSSSSGSSATNSSLSLGFGPRLIDNVANFSLARSAVADTTADTTVLAWHWDGFTTNDLAELWGADVYAETGTNTPARLTLWDNDHDRPNDQAVAANVVFGYLQLLDDDMVGPRMTNFLTGGQPGVLIATGFEEVDGWTTHADGDWPQLANDGEWQATGVAVVTNGWRANRCCEAVLDEMADALELPPVDRPGWLILWARLDGPGQSRLALDRWSGAEWTSLGTREITATNFAQFSWTIDSARTNEALRLRLAEQTTGERAIHVDDVVVAPNRDWINSPIALAWAAADDAGTGDSGVSEYRVVGMGGLPPVQVTNGNSVGLTLAATSAPSPAAQGAATGYVYAVDADQDRGVPDRAMGMPIPHVQRIDLTPPTVVHMGIGGTNASVETVDDPTTQFDLSWSTANVGPDDPGNVNHPTGRPSDRNLLSPWRSYKIYYGTYDPLEIPPNDVPTSETKGFIYTNFIATRAYAQWPSVCATNAIADPTAPSYQPNYLALTNVAQNQIRLYDLEYDQEYVVVVVGVDQAGNEGPAGIYSWATNNTIRFSLIRGTTIAKCCARESFPDCPALGNSDCETAAALYWIAAGQTNEQGIYTRVTKEYDLISWDADRFQERSNNAWRLVGSVRTNWFVDDGGHHRPRGQIRFYRASYKDRWKTSDAQGRKQRPLVSEEVYAQHNVILSRGQNFVALHGIPTVNTFLGVFGGTDIFPGGSSALPASGSTVVEFYSAGSNAPTADQYWLGANGHWYQVGSGADVSVVKQSPEFFTRGFSITLPDELPAEYVETTAVDNGQRDAFGNPVQVPAKYWEPILQVPTNDFSQTIYTGTRSGRVATVFYNVAALRLPVSAHPSEMRLTECGFVKGTAGAGDEIYTMNTATKSVLTGSTIYCDVNGVWRFSAGNGLVPWGYFKPNDVIVIVSRNGGIGNHWTWTYSATNFYALPTRWMGE